MRFFCLILALFFLTYQLFGQKIESVYLNKADSSSYRYLIITPSKHPRKEFMILIPSFGETPEGVLIQTKLPKLAADLGVLTIIPTFKTGVRSIGIDSLTQQSFREIIEDIASKYNLSDLKFYVGGFSIEGSCAVRFAELAIKNNYKYKPSAIYVIDALLDFERFYNSNKRNLRLSVYSQPSKETIYMIERIENERNT